MSVASPAAFTVQLMVSLSFERRDSRFNVRAMLPDVSGSVLSIAHGILIILQRYYGSHACQKYMKYKSRHRHLFIFYVDYF